MVLTVAEVLDLPEIRSGHPRVRSGGHELERAVRWVHVSEIPDIAGTLSGGELILSTGIVATDPNIDPDTYVRSLCEAEVAGLIVELAEGTHALPRRFVDAARAHGMVLVELRRSVRFVRVTEAVHGRILHSQFERWRFAQQVHAAFTALGLGPLSADDVLGTAVDLTGLSIVLEDAAHHAVTFAGPLPVSELLHDWTARSRRTPTPTDCAVVGPERWLCAAVEARNKRWGRLIAPRIPANADLDTLIMVLTRARDALAVSRLIIGEGVDPLRDAQSDLLHELLGEGAVVRDEAGLVTRMRALGLRPGRAYVVVVVALRDSLPEYGVERVEAALTRATRARGRPALTGRLAPDRIAAVFAGPDTADGGHVVEAAAESVRSEASTPNDLVFAAAGPVSRAAQLPAALAEAVRVADAARLVPEKRLVYRNADLGLRGLLWSIRHDTQLAQFTERTLRGLLDRECAHNLDLLSLLRSYLAVDGNIAELARRLHLSRPAVYGRLHHLNEALGVDLSDAEVKLSLHVALIAHDQLLDCCQRRPKNDRCSTDEN